MLTNVPVGLFGLYFVDFIGLKKSFWIGNVFNVIGTGFRIGGVIFDDIYTNPQCGIHTVPHGTLLISLSVLPIPYWIREIALLSVY